MALRLRRGTDAERLLITPVEGELIYTTDTKLLYAGDGSTAGGNVVTGAGVGSTTLDALTDTDLTGASDNDVLTYNSGTSKWESVAVPGVGILSLHDLSDVFMPSAPSSNDILRFDGVHFTAHPISRIFDEQQNYKINIVGDDSTIIINTDTNNVTGNFFGDLTGNVTGNITATGTFDGDMTGSLFADDSTLVVDGINGAIHSSVFTPNGSSIEIETPNAAATSVEARIISQDNDSILTLTRKSASDLSASSATLGTISFGVEDSNGAKSGAIILGNRNSLYLMADSAGTFSDAALAVTLTDGKLAVGSFGPATEKLDVVGNIKASGSIQPGVYADNTARDAAITSPVAGMIVFNTTGTKFQGYTGSAWADLN